MDVRAYSFRIDEPHRVGFFVWVGSFFLCVCMRWVAVAVVVWVGWWAFVVSHAIIARAGHTKKKDLSLSLSLHQQILHILFRIKRKKGAGRQLRQEFRQIAHSIYAVATVRRPRAYLINT